MEYYLETVTGKHIKLADLPRRVPSTTFMGDTHVEVCERLAQGIELPPRYHGTYVNLLVRKSTTTRQITSLIELQRAGRLEIRAIHAGASLERCSDLFDGDISIQLYPEPQGQLIDYKEACAFVKKFAIHHLFRLLRRRRLKTSTAIRGWVDTADQIYPDLVKATPLLVYPFKARPWRQIQYVRQCLRERRNFSLMGVPYRFHNLVRMLISSRNRDRVMVFTEASSAEKHADELLALGVKFLYEMCEYELAGYLMHEKLIDQGVRTQNTAHGVAVYGPYVRYNLFACYNQLQKRFYQAKGKVDQFQYIPNIPADAVAIPTSEQTFQPVVVYLQGNWRQAGKVYEAELETNVLKNLRTVCEKIGLSLLVKVHPNLTPENENQLRTELKVTTTRTLECEKTTHPIFLTLLSTSYYSYMAQGPIAIVTDDILRPESLFGDGVPSSHVDHLEEYLQPFRQSSHWAACHSQQIEEELSRTSLNVEAPLSGPPA